MPKYVMRNDESGETYTLNTDEYYLRQRLIGKGDVRPGAKFRFVSKLDDSTHTETLVSVGKKLVKTEDIRAIHNGTWPMKSDAMGINPVHRLEHMVADEELGVKIDYTDDGQAVFTSPGQYRRYCEAHGFFDRNSGYSGPKRRDSREREILGLPALVSRNQGLISDMLNEKS